MGRVDKRIGVVGAQALAEALRCNSTVTVLGLGGASPCGKRMVEGEGESR